MSVGRSSEHLVGRELGGYRIEALVGRGGMGAVYRAREAGLDRLVALKVIAPELAEDERFHDRFLRESRIAASLDHPHVVPIHRAGEENGLLFIAMRYVEGTDLAKLLAEEGALEPSRAVQLLEQVAEALDAAHERGLVHRDVKPSNVLIASAAGKEHCYLADFGLTKRTASLSGMTAPGDVVGTLEYVAPEQITGDEVDARSDLYSLGCVLYECLTGQAPFPRATDVALLWAHVHEEPAPPSSLRPELPRELDTVLARALAKEPARRYRSAGELVQATLQALGINEPTLRPGLARRVIEAIGAGDRRRLVVLASLIVLAAAAATLAIVRGESGPSSVSPTSVGVIDARTNELVDEISLGFTSPLIAAADGFVWVADPSASVLVKIDPRTREIVSRTAIQSGAVPTAIAAGGGSVWIAVLRAEERGVLEFGSELVEPRQEIEDLGAGLHSMTVQGGDVWLIDPDAAELVRIGVESGRLQRIGQVGLAYSLGVSPEAAWVGGANTVDRIDLALGSTVATIPVGSLPVGTTETSALAVGGETVWFVASAGTVLWKIDPRSNAPVGSISVGRGPSGVAVGEGAVWVANSQDGTVTRVDPSTDETTTISVGSSPGGVVVESGLVWTSPGEPVG